MRLWLVVLGVSGTLGLAMSAQAASDFDWAGTVGVGESYFNVENSDPAAGQVEDVQSRQTVGSNLTFDNAYLHMGLLYTLTAVQLQENKRLNYKDQQAQLNVNVDRWLRRYTQDGRLAITATGRVSPSLPPLDESRVAEEAAAADATERGDLTPTERIVRDDLLGIDEDVSGYTLLYGMRFSDEIDPFRRYEVGWLVTDNRYDSSIVADTALLGMRAAYTTRLSRGEAGVALRHQRFVRGDGGRLYGMSVFRAAAARRLEWRMEPGLTYRQDRKEYRGSFRAEAEATLPRVALRGAYGTDLGVITVGRTALVRTHRGLFGMETTRNYRFPRAATIGASLTEFVRRVEVTLAQRFRFRRSLLGVLSYARTSLWWEDAGAGTNRKRTSDVIAFNLRWSFL